MCLNRLTVTGPAADRGVFEARNREYPVDPAQTSLFEDRETGREESPLSFHASVPIPEDIADAHAWCSSHWGTKWNGSDVRQAHACDRLTYSFDTPWGPPKAWLLAVSALYPSLELTLEYVDNASSFAGRITAIAGAAVARIHCDDEDGIGRIARAMGYAG